MWESQDTGQGLALLIFKEQGKMAKYYKTSQFVLTPKEESTLRKAFDSKVISRVIPPLSAIKKALDNQEFADMEAAYLTRVLLPKAKKLR